LHAIPPQVASVVDILEAGGISWAEYQEDMPYTGFTGFNYTNPATDYVDYVRKHNPLVFSLERRLDLTKGDLRLGRRQPGASLQYQELYVILR